MKQSFAIMLSFSLLVSIFLQGCGVANQPYVKNDASEAAPLKMIRYETPNVRIYMPLPQSQYREQRTEEVYLPYGGTYRKTTEYISQNPRYAKVTPRHRIVNEGRYDSEKAQEQE